MTTPEQHTIFDYPDPLTPDDTPLDGHTDTQLAAIIREWKDLTNDK